MGVGKNGDSADPEETSNLTDHMLGWAKERLAAGAADPLQSEQAAPKTDRWEIGTAIVVAVRGDVPDQAEVRLFEDAAEAERFVQTLVEGKVEQERIAVLQANPVRMSIAYRPVVQLGVAGNLQESDEQDHQS